MKLATCLVLTCLLWGAGMSLAATPSEYLDLAEMQALKDQAVTGVPNPQTQVGGDDIATAVPIPALPYSDAGNTCTFFDDYDEVCPYSFSTSPDVVYSYAPAVDQSIDIDLCASLYDTKVYVYENFAGNLVACNDDAGCGITGWQSQLLCVPLTAGNVYYIVVDGYGGDCGNYDLLVSECVPCVVDCPAGALAEGEPDCYDGYDDAYNGGCNSSPYVFSNLPCTSGTLTVCGRYGDFSHPPSPYTYRDTDWYQIDVPAGGFANVTITAEGELPTLVGYLDGNAGCGSPFFVDYTTVPPCTPGSITVNLPPGPAWIFVATDGWDLAWACGADYTLTISGLQCPVSVEPASWADIKARYNR